MEHSINTGEGIVYYEITSVGDGLSVIRLSYSNRQGSGGITTVVRSADTTHIINNLCIYDYKKMYDITNYMTREQYDLFMSTSD